MQEKISATRFCDLQGVNDFDRHVIERKFRDQSISYRDWYNMLTEEGFEIGELKNFEIETTEKKK